MLLVGQLGELSLVRLRLRLAFVRAEAVVELVNHLALVEGQVALPVAHEDVAFEAEALALELLAGAEEARVVGHVEHREELDAPRVAGLAFGFVHQHRHPAVDVFGELGVAGGAKDRRGSGVGVEQAEILGREGEAAVGVGDVGRPPQKKGKGRAVDRPSGPAHSDEAELR